MHKRRIPFALAVVGLVPLPLVLPRPLPLAALVGDKKTDVEAVAKFLVSFAKRKALGKKDPEEIAKRIGPLKEDDLSWVLDRLREVPAEERGGAAPDVEKAVEDALLTVRYSAGVLQLPDAAKRLADASPEARCALLSDLSRLEDAEPATRVALWALQGGDLPVRLRALDVIADLCSWGGDASRLLPSLLKGLEDPSPAVRDLALERLLDMSEPAALDWAIAHLSDPAAEETVVRESKEKRCPGDRAVEVVTRVSKLHYGMDGASYRALDDETRKGLEEEFRAWRAKAGGNPLRSGSEGVFDPLPRTTSVVVDPRKVSEATVRWWSEVDRAQFRLDLDEMQVTAATKLDWSTGFRLTVTASGARQGTWEAFARKVRCGGRHRLPRRGFGLVETSIQPLLDGRWKVWVRAFEWRSG